MLPMTDNEEFVDFDNDPGLSVRQTPYLLDAVCCGHDPSVVDERPTASRAPILFEHDLPRPGTTVCEMTADNVWTDLQVR